MLRVIKDIFDMDKVRYSSVESLAEDTLLLLHQCSEQLLANEETDTLPQNTCSLPQEQGMPNSSGGMNAVRDGISGTKQTQCHQTLHTWKCQDLFLGEFVNCEPKKTQQSRG